MEEERYGRGDMKEEGMEEEGTEKDRDGGKEGRGVRDIRQRPTKVLDIVG
jgi:hypothetical protein